MIIRLKKACPQCHNHEFEIDKKDNVMYCTECFLVVSASYDYVGGNRIDLPFGILK